MANRVSLDLMHGLCNPAYCAQLLSVARELDAGKFWMRVSFTYSHRAVDSEGYGPRIQCCKLLHADSVELSG